MKNNTNKLIYFEEYIPINGISQYLFHCGTDYKNPVLLILHGGPGSAESIFSYTFQEKWENIFTVVHWDQRGAGKTLTENPDEDTFPTTEILLNDLKEIYRVLKQNGRIMLVFEMLKTPEEPDKWKAVEDKVGIKTVTEEEIREMLAKAGFEDIETHKKDGTTWLCAIGVKK